MTSRFTEEAAMASVVSQAATLRLSCDDLTKLTLFQAQGSRRPFWGAWRAASGKYDRAAAGRAAKRGGDPARGRKA